MRKFLTREPLQAVMLLISSQRMVRRLRIDTSISFDGLARKGIYGASGLVQLVGELDQGSNLIEINSQLTRVPNEDKASDFSASNGR